MPMALRRAWLAKLLPPSTKMSAWYMRLAPPDSTRPMSGSLFSRAISCARRPFFRPMGEMVPPLSAESEAVTRQRLPATTPMPMMVPPPSTFFLPSSSCSPRPARVDSSRKGVPRSIRRATRSRGSSWPRFPNFVALEAEPSRTCASRARTWSSRSCMRAVLLRKASDCGLRAERRAGILRVIRDESPPMYARLTLTSTKCLLGKLPRLVPLPHPLGVLVHAGQQGGHVQGLGQVAGKALVAGAVDLVGHGVGRERHPGHVAQHGLALQLAGQLETAHVAQVHVQQEQVGRLLARHGQGFGATGGHAHQAAGAQLEHL